ncbi:hypothetical protein APA_3568 [Pseudanabaena sp. lw0831]|nr:hypothetical protein APA_3568 [Pseudanabaena sp. lw0831]
MQRSAVSQKTRNFLKGLRSKPFKKFLVSHEASIAFKAQKRVAPLYGATLFWALKTAITSQA